MADKKEVAERVIDLDPVKILAARSEYSIGLSKEKICKDFDVAADDLDYLIKTQKWSRRKTFPLLKEVMGDQVSARLVKIGVTPEFVALRIKNMLESDYPATVALGIRYYLELANAGKEAGAAITQINTNIDVKALINNSGDSRQLQSAYDSLLEESRNAFEE
jgi:hypothetical protein